MGTSGHDRLQGTSGHDRRRFCGLRHWQGIAC
ncbi:MAG: hypothetical protein GC149_20515 [Gammaproteobacteria bacterium]|nr:hypothetical protein [Gammaproteobacteria bacterium]